MRTLLSLAMVIAMVGAACAAEEEFVELFNGKNLDGWKAGGNPDSFKVEDGLLRVNGSCSHLFYEGDVHNHCWKNFHAQVVVMTKPKANSGIYIHTKFQKEGWPTTGYECQVANTHGDPQKTASIYNVCQVNPAPANDDEWFVYDIIVQGSRITTMINGKICADWKEPKDIVPPKGWENRRLGEGTFAIQAHDPGSVVFIKSFKVKPLDD